MSSKSKYQTRNYSPIFNQFDSDEQKQVISNLQLDNQRQEKIIKIILNSTNFVAMIVILITGGLEKNFGQYFIFSLLFLANIAFQTFDIFVGLIFITIAPILSMLSFFLYSNGVSGPTYSSILLTFCIVLSLEIIMKNTEKKYLDEIKELNETSNLIQYIEQS
ncbi:hypothetical protein TRFO_11751 [Tritrichomonas foetus]|uniref:Transmembrane protein n=1 Tax=Tritrichomonas foetus TaxID=1144522 RepID=A0A1J4J5V9_9EUKA|nr:hypothetical protein TRFO_11751 [Tritrichomonas foetus]|eukprot:OHS93535.1 hypothetical protein TRFO_11751 [Tritrichomonas foetus]